MRSRVLDRRVILVGRGRMAGAFARAFRAHGIAFASVRGRSSPAGLKRARGDARRVCWILAVRDPAVEAVCESLESAALVGRGDAVVHLAGMLGNDVLAIAHDAGALTGALHPLVAVADPKRPPTLDGAALSFEGDAPLARWLAKLFAPTGARVFRLAQVDRVRYHAAAALCATGAVALAQGAAALFAEAARDADADAIRAFTRSLLASAAHNVFVAGPSRALASPIMRGDTATVERHLASMRIAPRARAMYAAALLQAVDTLAREQSVAPAVLTAVQRMARKSSR